VPVHTWHTGLPDVGRHAVVDADADDAGTTTRQAATVAVVNRTARRRSTSRNLLRPRKRAASWADPDNDGIHRPGLRKP
jgi:hypothetical protein